MSLTPAATLEMARSVAGHRLLLGLVFCALTVLRGSAADATTDAASLDRRPGALGELLDFRNLPRLKSWQTRQAAGYDRGGGFYDSGNFLRTEPDRRHVLLEHDGPGVIDRLWFTYKSEFRQEPYDLLIYLDQTNTPAIAMNLDDLFSNVRAPFLDPLAGRCGHPQHPGRFSYVPLGFARCVKVVLQPTAPPERYQYRQNSRGETIPHLYYQITWRQLPAAASVRRFSWTLDSREASAWQRLRSIWRQAGALPWGDLSNIERQELDHEIAPHGGVLLAERRQPGVLCGLRLRTRDAAALRLQFIWDHQPEPSVAVPFGPFFGASTSGAARTEVRGLWLGCTNGTYYHYLPMPFHQAARLEVASSSSQPVRITGELFWLKEVPAADDAHFCARRYDYAPPPAGEDYVVLDAIGHGHFAGLVMDRPGQMEGDDRLWVDGESVPSLHGTGTEDFFNFAWGLSHTGAWPLHGITQQPGGPVAYRLHLPAGVPFARSLRITWEHGHDPARGPNLDAGRYSGVVFYYRR